jgi:hypothetical protein
MVFARMERIETPMTVQVAATDVFTPSAYPKHTYVRRDDDRLERRLRDALETPGEVISVSGPSKSGKTVLVERVVGGENLIPITGAGLRSGQDLWRRFATWLGLPTASSHASGTSHGGTIGVHASGEAGIPLVAKGKIEGQGSLSSNTSRGSNASFEHYGLQQVVKEVGGSCFVLLIDDFHYMPREVQSEVAKEIKEAARQGVKIVTASVPHRSDDVVRSNPELRGRVRAIDSDYWKTEDLHQIAKLGFPLLNVSVDQGTIDLFANEAAGSPQLMQAACLQACFSLNARSTQREQKAFSIEDATRREILEEAATRTDYSSLVRKCHRGPLTRGTERKEYLLSDGSTGDVYRAVLLSLAASPLKSSFTYPELSTRIGNTCTSGVPQAASIYQACGQIAGIALEMCPGERVIEWNDDDSILDVVDPYFLFFLRHSNILRAVLT